MAGGAAIDARDISAQKRYQQLVRERGPKPKIARDLLRAFILGGAFGLVGQFLLSFFHTVERTPGECTATTLAGMILLGAVLTGMGIYDVLAEWGGAGAAVPITGFSNTITSAAMEFRREGLILGLGARMFVIAGPVLVFGTIAGFLTGLVKVALLGLLR